MSPFIRGMKVKHPPPYNFHGYLWFRHVDAHEVDELADKEVEAEVLVDGVAVTLQASEEAEGEEADCEADERHGDAHSRDDGEEKLVDAAVTLQRNRRRQTDLQLHTYNFNC